MEHIESVAVAANATFGRDGAMFEGLLEFVAQLSLVLWSVVVFTAVVRFIGIRVFRLLAARRELAGLAAPNPLLSLANLSGSDSEMAAAPQDQGLRPAATPADPSSSTLPRHAARSQHAISLSSLQTPALASRSEE